VKKLLEPVPEQYFPDVIRENIPEIITKKEGSPVTEY
jgi:predicted house-cleaning noncanonical NTP pyrophosphatase (MazG superfamily)